MTKGAPSELASSGCLAEPLSEVVPLGEGAAGTVFRARDASGAWVSLKVARPEALRSWGVEALHAGLALGPRLPELRGIGRVRRAGDRVEPDPDGQPALALRFAQGQSLRENPPHTPDAIAKVARDLGDALASLHAAGVAHGDVKPDNVIHDPTEDVAALIDLGLAGPAAARAPRGGTPRYLPQGDASLGDARSRDLLALGILLAELASPEVATAARPLEAAREAALPEPIAGLCLALLTPDPGSRPSAAWVADIARAHLGEASAAAQGQAEVRSSYLRLRRHALGEAVSASPAAAPWLHDALAHITALRALAGDQIPDDLSPTPSRVLEPLDLRGRHRWLVTLVGPAAADWPEGVLAPLDEPAFADTLLALARKRRPSCWTLRDVERALSGQAPTEALVVDLPLGPGAAAELALRVGRRPTDHAAVELVERIGLAASAPLCFAAADALRLRGEHGRARRLVHGLAGAEPLVADILRRAGDRDAAAQVASASLDADPRGLAHAVLARIHLDRGRLDEAAAVVGARPGLAATAEVAALLAAARGHQDRALAEAQRGRALATTPESRARMAATLAYVLSGQDAAAARDHYREAVRHAVEAGAVLEEATYRTGEASASVDLGELSAGIETARRAALLWDDVLGRPGMAARAWLARAAAYAGIEARHEATQAAERALRRARLAEDRRAEAYAAWAILDAHPGGEPSLDQLAERATEGLGDDRDDLTHGLARRLRHGLEVDLEAVDARARHATASVSDYARVAWWSARATRLLEGDAGDARLVLGELAALSEARVPVLTRGRAMAVAAALAAATGDTDAHGRFDAARKRDGRTVLLGCTGGLAETARAASWLARIDDPTIASADHDQALDLGRLVRSLSERKSLRALLDRIVDVLLIWTGAERGLLLLQAPGGELQPRSARNLSRDDLSPDQLTVSTTLARRAMDSAEPVVAIDAMEELSSSYDSVHALKLRSVLAVPLAAHGKTLGCVYLDDRMRRGAFGEREVSWARAVAPIAALAISDAMTQVSLRRAVRRADRAKRALEESLAEKETALEVAERELAGGRGARGKSIYDDIIGESAAIRRVLELVDRVAPSDVPVLLRGQSGSGKEIVARAIHRASPRAQQPFVGENCGALPESLLESTLFGHVRGAFTGAHRPRVGLFEAADGGTLFLDEIGEMSLGMQTKLLRILEDHLVRPVGSTQTREVNVRVLAATHRDIEEMVAAGAFREDLYYRLNVITIPIPSLEERSDDIPLLVRHLLDKHGPPAARGPGARISSAALAELARRPWPGNVRQLENEIRRALLLAEGTIEVSDLSATGDGPSPAELTLDVRTRIDRLEEELVTEALARTDGNQTQAAKLLGLSRYGLHKMMRRLNLKD